MPLSVTKFDKEMLAITGFLKERDVFGPAEVVMLSPVEVEVVMVSVGLAEVVMIIKTLDMILAVCVH